MCIRDRHNESFFFHRNNNKISYTSYNKSQRLYRTKPREYYGRLNNIGGRFFDDNSFLSYSIQGTSGSFNIMGTTLKHNDGNINEGLTHLIMSNEQGEFLNVSSHDYSSVQSYQRRKQNLNSNFYSYIITLRSGTINGITPSHNNLVVSYNSDGNLNNFFSYDNLTINNTEVDSDGQITAVVKSTGPFQLNGRTYDITGDVIIVGSYDNCDVVYDTIAYIACDNFEWNGNSYSSSGYFNDTIQSVFTCDTVKVLNLTINSSNTTVASLEACDSLTWINGITYYFDNNTATDTLQNMAGCDSIVTLNLTINESKTVDTTAIVCDSMIWYGATLTTTGNYQETFQTTKGCDSIVTLNLTINQSTFGTDDLTACDSLTWIDGITYTASNNTATHTLTAVNGCDSVVTLDLTINNSFFILETLTECDSLTWPVNGVTYYTSGTYYDSTLTTNNCDSVYQLDLTINTSPSIDLGADTTLICAGTSETLDAGTGFASYLWNDGSTNQTLSATTAGTYTVTGTDANGCTTSDRMVIEVLNVDIAQNDTTICEGDNLVLLVNSQNLLDSINTSVSQIPSNMKNGVVAEFLFNGSVDDINNINHGVSNNEIYSHDRHLYDNQSINFSNSFDSVKITNSNNFNLNEFTIS